MIFVEEIQNTCYDLPGTIISCVELETTKLNHQFSFYLQNIYLLEKLGFIYLLFTRQWHNLKIIIFASR